MENRIGKLARRWALALAMTLAGIAGNASAILLDRGPDMVYDTVLNITWQRHAGEPGASGDGGFSLNWAEANAWSAALVFGGFDDWRLPYVSVTAGAGPITFPSLPSVFFPCEGTGGTDELACRDNELAYMFYYNLGGKPGENKSGNQTAVGGELLTGIHFFHWSGTALDSDNAWRLDFLGGNQLGSQKQLSIRAWAVRPGDVCDQQPDLCPDTVPGVPEPGSLLLVALGAMGLAWSRRRRQ